MKKDSIHLLLVLLVSLIPAGYLLFIWDTLPQVVPVHFGADMKPDRMGDKSELWIPTLFLAGVSVFTYLLLTNVHRIDPKRKSTGQSSTFNKLARGIVVFMAAINFILISSAKGESEIQHFLFPLIGLLFAFIGNYMNNIKPNYFAGFRLPWTLSNDENWRRTHQLASKVWFAGGILIAITGFLLPPTILVPVFLFLVAVMVLIPSLYSYRIFKQQMRA